MVNKMTESEEVQRIKRKGEDSQVRIVKKIMEQPEIQNILKKNINKQTFISGLFMAFLLIGFLEISQAIKTLYSYTWEFDLVAGIVLIATGAIYMVKEIALKSESK